jgi:phage-related protein
MKRAPALFFRTVSGGEPVRDWLKAMPQEDRRRIGEDLKTIEFGWPIGMPLCRSMGGGLHELRTQLDNNRIARLLFYVDRRQRLVVLHGFIKKSRKAPAGDLDIARTNKRLHERNLA